MAISALTVIRVQVAGIYLHASLGKLAVQEWVDGSALYYWLLDPVFGATDFWRPLVMPILTSGIGVATLTWGTVALEFCIALGLVLDKRWWRYILLAGIALHVLIAVFMGLVSFGLAMAAALILHLRPYDRPFTCGMPMQLPDTSCREPHIDAGHGL